MNILGQNSARLLNYKTFVSKIFEMLLSLINLIKSGKKVHKGFLHKEE